MEFGIKNLNTAQAQEIPPNTAGVCYLTSWQYANIINTPWHQYIHAICNILLLESIHKTSEMSILCPFMSTEHHI